MSVQNASVPQICEESDNQCVVCYEDVREKGDFFAVLHCCNHIHCKDCMLQWINHQDSEGQQFTCTYCRKEFYWFTTSLIPMKSYTSEQKKEYDDFIIKNTLEVSNWQRNMRRNGMKVEQCTFNCGVAEILEDGSLMCPHGYYDKERYEEDQRRKVEQAQQKKEDEEKILQAEQRHNQLLADLDHLLMEMNISFHRNQSGEDNSDEESGDDYEYVVNGHLADPNNESGSEHGDYEDLIRDDSGNDHETFVQDIALRIVEIFDDEENGDGHDDGIYEEDSENDNVGNDTIEENSYDDNSD